MTSSPPCDCVDPRGDAIWCSSVTACSQMAASPIRTSPWTTVPSSARCSPARGEAEGPDQEVMGRLDVLVDEDGNDRCLGDGALLNRHALKVPSRPSRRLGET